MAESSDEKKFRVSDRSKDEPSELPLMLSTEALNLALEAYKKDGGFGANGKVAKFRTGTYKLAMKPYYKKYGVNRNTFSKAVNQRQRKDNKFKPIFSDDNEKLLFNFVKLKRLLSSPMTRQGLQLLAKEFLQIIHQKKINAETNPIILNKLRNQEIKEPGRCWANHFLKRYENELIKVGEMIEENSGALSPELLDNFYEVIGNIFSSTGLSFNDKDMSDEELYSSIDTIEFGMKIVEKVLEEIQELQIPESSDPQMHFFVRKIEKTLRGLTNPIPSPSEKGKKSRSFKYDRILTNPKKKLLETSQSSVDPKKLKRQPYCAKTWFKSNTAVLPERYDNFCNKCQNRGPKSSFWVLCGGGCSRWYHHLCVPELAQINNLVMKLKKMKWLCPSCDKWGPFSQ